MHATQQPRVHVGFVPVTCALLRCRAIHGTPSAATGHVCACVPCTSRGMCVCVYPARRRACVCVCVYPARHGTCVCVCPARHGACVCVCNLHVMGHVCVCVCVPRTSRGVCACVPCLCLHRPCMTGKVGAPQVAGRACSWHPGQSAAHQTAGLRAPPRDRPGPPPGQGRAAAPTPCSPFRSFF